MTKIILFLISGFFIMACRSEAKMEEAKPSIEAKSGKMTRPEESPDQFRMGIQIHIQGLSDEDGLRVAKGFEDQLAAFEPCLKMTGKGEIVRIKATFKLSKQGLVTNTEVIEVVPKAAEFKSCFLKQIEHLDLGAQKKEVRGELTLGTFYGEPSGWGTKPKRVK